MTLCSTETPRFDSLGAKQILGNSYGGRITSDTGFLLLSQIDKCKGLVSAMSNVISDPRDPSRIEHD